MTNAFDFCLKIDKEKYLCQNKCETSEEAPAHMGKGEEGVEKIWQIIDFAREGLCGFVVVSEVLFYFKEKSG